MNFARLLRVPANLMSGLVSSIAAFAPCIGDGCGRHREWERTIHKSK